MNIMTYADNSMLTADNEDNLQSESKNLFDIAKDYDLEINILKQNQWDSKERIFEELKQ